MNELQEGWIRDTYYRNIFYKKAKEVKDIEGYKREAEKEGLKIISETEQGYWRIKKSNECEQDEYGDYCYTPCEKSKGAVLYYFAGVED